MRYSTYQQTRIAKGAPGFGLATDAVAQRGLSLDITQIGTARWLDMYLETTPAWAIDNMVAHEKELIAILARMIDMSDEARKTEALGALRESTERYLPSDTDRRARYNLFDAITRADVRYGRENVAAFIAEFHPHALGLLDVVAARA